MRIVITSFGSYGDVNPYVGLALGLRARGHDPVLAMPAWYRGYVEREGLAFHPVRPDVDPADRATVARIMDGRRGTEYLLRRVLLPSLEQSWTDLAPALDGADFLVSHPVTFAAPLLAELRGLPWASTSLAPMHLFSAHDFPELPGAPFARPLAERVPAVARALVRLGRAVTRPWLAPVARLRAAHGLPPVGHPLFEGQHSPHLVLALFSRVLGTPQPDWPPHTVVTGAIPYNGPILGDRPGLPDDLARFLDAGPPPVVFTLGTSAVMGDTARRFYAESVDAARRLGVRAVLLVGPDPANRPVVTSSDVHVAEFAPHADLFPRAAAVVHQGGAGTMHQALRAGHPMLVVPHAHDQPDFAHRGVRLGVARTLPPSAYRAAAVARALGALLGDPRYAERARAVGARVAAEDGVADACDAVERCMRGAPAVRAVADARVKSA